MRGSRPSVVRVAFLTFLVLLLVGAGATAALPLQPAAVPAAPASVPADAGATLADLLREVPRDALAGHAGALAALAGPSPLPKPDDLPGYDRLDDEAARVAWGAWIEASAWAAQRGSDPMGFRSFDEAAPPDPAVEVALAEAPARGLTSIWSLDEHGQPNALQPAGGDGAHFLVTSEGVIRFASANASPDWMVKPGGYIGRTETTDVDGDGVLDIVLGLYSWWVSDDPSIVVVDGANGTILWTGLSGLDSMYVWTLSDVDGDGSDDIMGLDAAGRLVAYTLDGTAHYQVEVPELSGLPSGGFLVFYLAMYHEANMGHLFADVDGDGTTDFAVASALGNYLGLLITGFRTEVPMISAYSGRDASLLWQVPTGAARLTGGYTFPVSSGDFDGDGGDDLLIADMERRYLPGAMNVELHYRILSGAAGLPLARDVGGSAFVCMMACAGTPYGETYEPIALADVDGDGLAEVVGVVATYGPFSLTVVGRGAPTVPSGPLTELYRHELVMDADYEWADGRLMFRDVDADGDDDVVAFLLSEVTDEEGHIEDVAVHRFFVDEAGATGGRLEGLLGFYDVLPGGMAFGWDVRTDRWASVDDAGVREADGFRLVLSTYPMLITDRNDDRVPDLMLRKTIGYLWIDGRNGRLLEDIERPITSYAVGVYEENGRHRILEQEWSNDMYRLIDATTMDEVWTVPGDLSGDRGWMRGLADVTGDGRLDLLFENWGRIVILPADDGPLSSSERFEEPERRFWVVDALSKETVFEVDVGGGSVWVADAVTTRSGEELLMRTRDGEARMLELHVPGEDAPRWSYNLGDGGLRAAEDGYVLVAVEQESEVFEVLLGDSGEQVAVYPLPADARASQTFFTRVDSDRFPDLVTSFIVEEADESTAQEMVIFDWANDKEVARYGLEKGTVETMYLPEWDYEFTYERHSFVSEEIGDWDKDGLVDFAYREADRAVVRSTGTGEILAIAPGKGQFIRAHDMNAAGPKELMMMTDEGRLRLFSYAPRVDALEEPATEGIRTITSVDESETHAEDFFDDMEDQGIPAPGFGLALLFLAFVVFVVRRRKEE